MKIFNKIIGNNGNKPLQAKNKVSLPIETPFRIFGLIFLLLLIASVSMIIITVRDSLVDKKVSQLLDEFYQNGLKYGLAIDDIIIEGREKTTKEDLLNAIGLSRENNILDTDLKEIKQKIEQLPWVEKADIKRTYFPNILQVKLYEKEVLALWQNDGKFYPLDMNGKIIDAEYVAHKPILVITGENAPEHIIKLLKITSQNPELNNRIVAAVLFSQRRWNLIFDSFENGITVKLPQDDMQQAWKKFVKINNQYDVLNRKLTIIDLRYKNKVSVALSNTVDEK
ncbi:MAG: FtsQ-type POTRA domain-containing protein [Alphaproteobacteria bacterium]|nr:FtsQ-type POTRA domain-containing protein [Alphaproteobacteria bacterium]